MATPCLRAPDPVVVAEVVGLTRPVSVIRGLLLEVVIPKAAVIAVISEMLVLALAELDTSEFANDDGRGLAESRVKPVGASSPRAQYVVVDVPDMAVAIVATIVELLSHMLIVVFIVSNAVVAVKTQSDCVTVWLGTEDVIVGELVESVVVTISRAKLWTRAQRLMNMRLRNMVNCFCESGCCSKEADG